MVTPFVTAAELQVVPGNAETPDVVDFATGHPQLFNLMSGLRWLCTAILWAQVKAYARGHACHTHIYRHTM